MATCIMTSGAWRLLALLALLAASASAQVNAPLELTTSNFAKAAQQPIAWLINVEQSTNEQSRMAATMLKPALSQAVQYYHTMQPNKGVRVAHLDVVRVFLEHSRHALRDEHLEVARKRRSIRA